MKTHRILMAFIAIVVSMNGIFGVKPLIGDPTDFATKKVLLISNLIQLTDSQKLLIKIKANILGTKILNKDSVSYQIYLLQANNEYKLALDSILTSEQKQQLIQIRTNKKNAAITAYKNKDKKNVK